MITITSSNNQQIKNIIQLNSKAKARREQGNFVVEGIKMFQEAPINRIEKVYVSETFYKEHEGLSKLQECPLEVVEDRVFKGMTDTQTPQGVLCVVKQFSYELEDILGNGAGGKAPYLAILEDLQDPGNVGTIFRTAEGAGVTGIILSKKCVDIYNPKTIRATMGSIYRMPFIYVEDIVDILPDLHKASVITYGAHLNGRGNYDQEDYTKGSAFLIGNEGNGLSERLSERADCLIKIPMEGQLESLNAAMAAGILMYEGYRQRRK